MECMHKAFVFYIELWYLLIIVVIEDYGLRKSICVIELKAEFATYLWNTIFTWKYRYLDLCIW